MFIRRPMLTVAAMAMITALGAAPSPALAQPSTTNSEQACRDFSWLLGTWNSYSPWGDRTAPTGGSLVFTMTGGTVEGRIGSLNSYMEENGYTAGMVVFRGLTDLRSFGPNGTTRFEARGGEYLQSDGETARWRSGGVGVRQNGELYMLPTAIAALSGHGPFRRAGGTQVSDPCVPATPQEPAQAPAVFDQDAMLRSMLLRDQEVPPVILNPSSCPPDNTAENRSFDESLARVERILEAAYREQGDESLAAESSETVFRYYRSSLFEELDALIVAAMFEQSDVQRAEYERRAKEIMRVLDPYTDAQLAREAAEEARIERELRRLTEPTVDEGFGRCDNMLNMITVDPPKSTPVEPATTSNEPAIPIQSVRNDVQGIVPDLYNGDDEAERVENLQDMRSALNAMDPNDPAREGLGRAYRTLYSRIEQEYNAARELRGAQEPGSDSAQFYSDLAERLHGQLVEFQPMDGRVAAELGLAPPLEGARSVLDGNEPSASEWTLYEMFRKRSDQAAEFGRTPEDLTKSKAGRSMRSAYEHAYGADWSYDADLDRILQLPPVQN